MKQLNEKSPEGWTGTVRAMKLHHPEIKNPYALAHSMKNKGDEAHYKDQESSKEGTPHKKEKFKDEDKKEWTFMFPTWQEWVELRESQGCNCLCKSCKEGKCAGCTCADCNCSGCGCK
jgi:hypothetical protein